MAKWLSVQATSAAAHCVQIASCVLESVVIGYISSNWDKSISSQRAKRLTKFRERKGLIEKDVDDEAYAYLLNVLAREYCDPATLDAKDPFERENLVLDHAERMGCKRYLNPHDIVEGSSNLNLAFIATIFQRRNGLSLDGGKVSFAEMMTDDLQTSREEANMLYYHHRGAET